MQNIRSAGLMLCNNNFDSYVSFTIFDLHSQFPGDKELTSIQVSAAYILCYQYQAFTHRVVSVEG